MATRRFCDLCDDKIPTDGNHTGRIQAATRLRRTDGLPAGFDVNVSVAVEPTGDSNTFDICIRCVFRAVRQIDPTPQPDGGEDRG